MDDEEWMRIDLNKSVFFNSLGRHSQYLKTSALNSVVRLFCFKYIFLFLVF